MKILIKPDATSYSMGTPAVYRNALESIRGQWVEVETDYLFQDQFNTVPMLGGNGLRIMMDQVVAIQDDAREGKAKCRYCGHHDELSQFQTLQACPKKGCEIKYMEVFQTDKQLFTKQINSNWVVMYARQYQEFVPFGSPEFEIINKKTGDRITVKVTGKYGARLEYSQYVPATVHQAVRGIMKKHRYNIKYVSMPKKEVN